MEASKLKKANEIAQKIDTVKQLKTTNKHTHDKKESIQLAMYSYVRVDDLGENRYDRLRTFIDQLLQDHLNELEEKFRKL